MLRIFGRPQNEASLFAQRWHGMKRALFAQAQQSAACNASHSVEARLSRWLLRACDCAAAKSCR